MYYRIAYVWMKSTSVNWLMVVQLFYYTQTNEIILESADRLVVKCCVSNFSHNFQVI